MMDQDPPMPMFTAMDMAARKPGVPGDQEACNRAGDCHRRQYERVFIVNKPRRASQR